MTTSTAVVQVDGKITHTITVPEDITNEDLLALVMESMGHSAVRDAVVRAPKIVSFVTA